MTPTPAGTPPDQQLPPVVAGAATPIPPDPKVARLEADLAETRRMVDSLRPTQPQQAPNIQELNRQFYQAPISATQAIATQAVNEALQRYGAGHMDTLIETAKQQARSSDPAQQAIFDKYEGEIKARVAMAEPQFHANSTVWKSAFDMVKGSHLSEIIAASKPEAPAIHISREGGPAGANGKAPVAPAGVKLTDDQSEMAKNLGLNKEQYARGIEMYEKQSSRGPSSFDEVITFSSEDKRRAERAKRRAAK